MNICMVFILSPILRWGLLDKRSWRRTVCSKTYRMHRSPTLTCKLIAIRVIPRCMKNRYANPPIRIYWIRQHNQQNLNQKDSMENTYYGGSVQERKKEITIWVPHLWCKSDCRRAVGIISRKAHNRIEIATLTARFQSWKQCYEKMITQKHRTRGLQQQPEEHKHTSSQVRTKSWFLAGITLFAV